MARLAALATIGYEGASLPTFLATLRDAGITLLLDVRELASSRHKGFAKTALSQALTAAGIEYRHERALGTPRTLRHRLRKGHDYASYFVDFKRYLATQSGLLDELAATLTGRVALMCLERDPQVCHRSVVATALAQRVRRTVRHLSVPLEGPGRATPAQRGTRRRTARSRN